MNTDRTQLVAKLQGLLDTLQAIPSTNATADALDSLHVCSSLLSSHFKFGYSILYVDLLIVGEAGSRTIISAADGPVIRAPSRQRIRRLDASTPSR